MAEPVQVEGLREFLGELRKVDSALPKALQAANKGIAEAVAGKTRASFAGRSGVAPKVAASVKTYAQQRGAQVSIGGGAYPYAMGAEFGSVRFKQFPAWRGSSAGAGYSLFPSIRASRDEIERRFLAAVDEVSRRAFPS